MSSLQNPPISTALVNPETGRGTTTFTSWLTKLYNRVGNEAGISAPADATYIVQSPNIELDNAQALSDLASGILVVDGSTGILSSLGTTSVDIENGGTSRNSFEPNCLVCGGETATAPLEQVENPGTAGQVLYSNGITELPTFGELMPPIFTCSLCSADADLGADLYNNGLFNDGVGAYLDFAVSVLPATIDGGAYITGDLILVGGQANSYENGIYVADVVGQRLTRYELFDNSSRGKIRRGTSIYIIGGSIYSGRLLVQNHFDFSTDTVGVDSILFNAINSPVPLPLGQGGTGNAGFGSEGIIYWDATASPTNLDALPKDTNATRYVSNQGTNNHPSWDQINLANGVTGDLPFANLTQGSALSVLGVTGNATADNASITAGTDKQVLRRSGTTVAFGAIDLTSTNAVTGDLPFSSLAQGTALSVIGVTGNSTADVASIAAGTDKQILRRSGTTVAFGAIDLSSSDAVSGNLPVTNLNSGTSASSSTYWRGDGTWATLSGGGDALTTNPLSQFAATTSLQLKGVVSDETGSGALVFATSPTLATPLLGIPTSGTLTNCTGLPISTGVSGLGTNVATFLATPSSANLISAVTDETGSGALVFANTPTLVTPLLGTPTSGTLTNCTFPTLNQNTSGTAASCPKTVNSGNDGIVTDSSGRNTLPNQPLFIATGGNATDVTGDGTAYTIIFGTAGTNRGTVYNTATGVFTAPVTGTYLCNSVVHVSGWVAQTVLELGFKINGTLTDNFYCNGATMVTGGEVVLPLCLCLSLAATDTVSVCIAAYGSTKTVDLASASQKFSVILLG